MIWKKSNDHQGSLAKATEISADPAAIEILSAWVRSDGTNVVVVKADVWPDPAAWGLLLADVTRHIASALKASANQDQAATIARIREGFEAELGSPTDQPRGGWR